MDVAIGRRVMDDPLADQDPMPSVRKAKSGNGGGFLWFVSFDGKRNEQKKSSHDFKLTKKILYLCCSGFRCI